MDILLPDDVQKFGGLEQKDGFARLQAQVLMNGLVTPSFLLAEGVPLPWAPAVAFNWQISNLNDRQGKQALETLRMVLLCMYFGMLRPRSLKLEANAGASSLRTVLFHALRQAEGQTERSLVLYEWDSQLGDPAPGMPRVVAGSLFPEWPFFPSTWFQTLDGKRELGRVLLDAHGPRCDDAALTDDLDLAQDDARREFTQLVASAKEELQRDGQVPALATALGEIVSRSSKPSERTNILDRTWPLEEVFLPTRTIGLPWLCPRHEADHSAWAYDRRVADLHVQRGGELMCTEHECSLTKGGHPVTTADLGAAELSDGTLVLWEGGPSDPNVHFLHTEGEVHTFQYGIGPKFRVAARRLKLEELFVDPLPLPRGALGADSTVPIKTEYLHLVGDLEWRMQGWRVTIQGRSEPVDMGGVRRASMTAPAQAGVVVWPPKTPAGWSADVIAVNLPPADDVAVIVEKDKRLRTGPFVEFPCLLGDHDGSPKYLALRKGGAERGVIPLTRGIAGASERESGAQGYIAVDFGTSNTVVAYGIGERAEYLRNGVEQVGRSACCLSEGADFFKDLKNGLAIFSEWFETPQPSPLLGTLLFERSQERKDVRVPRILSVVPKQRDLLKNQALRKDDTTTFYESLKWEELGQLRQRPLIDYFCRLLVPAILRLVVQSHATAVTVSFTFPLAFERRRFNNFKAAAEKACARLDATTGVPVRLGEFFSESEAGVAAANNLNTEYQMTIDLGGGTADFALFKTGEAPAVLAADSLRIGGRHILEVMMPKDDGGSRREGLSATSLLEATLQSGDKCDVQNRLGTMSADCRIRLSTLTAAIVVAAHRMLASLLPEEGADGRLPTVGLTLLGQGWLFFDGDTRLIEFLSEEKIADAIQELGAGRYRVERSLLDDGDHEARGVARKRTVAEGAYGLLVRKRIALDPRNHAFLGLDLTASDGEVLPAKTLVREASGTQLVLGGDPGFDSVLADLIRTTEYLCDVGDGKKAHAVLADEKRREELIKKGATIAQQQLQADGDARSPLFLFLSDAWR